MTEDKNENGFEENQQNYDGKENRPVYYSSAQKVGDFFIGFIAASLIGGISMLYVYNAFEVIKIPAYRVLVLAAVWAVLSICLIAFTKRRYIGIGILVPLLMILVSCKGCFIL